MTLEAVNHLTLLGSRTFVFVFLSGTRGVLQFLYCMSEYVLVFGCWEG